MEYTQGVKILADYALNQGGSGAYAAAQVLLSAYNGNTYQVSLVDLCSLDQRGYEAAIAVIRGRVETFREPHEVIANGHEVFEKLERRWASLKAGYRYAKIYIEKEIIVWKCPHCGATTSDYAQGPYPGRVDGKPVCANQWTDLHPEDEASLMEPV